MPAWFRQQWRHCCLRLVLAGMQRASRTRAKQRLANDHWSLWHLRQGSMRCVGSAGALDCVAGDSWLMPPRHTVHHEIAAGSELFVANFDVLPAAGWDDPLRRLALPALLHDGGDPTVWSALCACFSQWRPCDDESVLRGRPALDNLLLAHLTAGFAAGLFANAGRGNAPAWLEDLAMWVCAHALEPDLGPAAIVRQAGYSTRHVCGAFRRHYACTPGDFLRRQRMAVAARLVRERRDETLHRIAQRCGYRDAALFSRHFSQAFGRSPRAWRTGDDGG
jgi:AraC-like DNA-binding protein